MTTVVARRQEPMAPDTTEGKKSPDENKSVLSQQSVLPELKSSSTAIDKTKPLPTSLQSDFLPDELLFALTQSPAVKDRIKPPGSKSLNVSSIPSRPAPDNLWSYKRKEKFKHLSENIPCICGAGRDISFLYDVPNQGVTGDKPDTVDPSVIRRDAEKKQHKPLQLPDTLLPSEYHIVKNRGVMGIEYVEDQFTTQPEDHEKHLVLFPSLKPGSRYEVVQLKKSFEDMLDKLGINDLEIENQGPTQMHNILELIKKEQNIYNVIFHEVIRQVTVECAERGELLSAIRQKYSDLLSRIPIQIKSLHEEVMAQRALDRRLTEELLRFKATISFLTQELTVVKEHDDKVTRQAQEAQEDLKRALAEAQKNTSLLAEYHDLYELQRHRLEKQVVMLSEEKELWSTASYSLALKVTEECKLTTAKRLNLCERAWTKLADHFTVLLSDKDTEMLTALQVHVDTWRESIDDFHLAVRRREEETRVRLKEIRSQIQQSLSECHSLYYNTSGHLVRIPEKQNMEKILTDIRHWEEILSKEAEIFGGDVVLSNIEEIERIQKEMEGWTDKALKLFGRHRGFDSRTHPEQKTMTVLNAEVEKLLKQFHTRVTGENGGIQTRDCFFLFRFFDRL